MKELLKRFPLNLCKIFVGCAAKGFKVTYIIEYQSGITHILVKVVKIGEHHLSPAPKMVQRFHLMLIAHDARVDIVENAH